MYENKRIKESIRYILYCVPNVEEESYICHLPEKCLIGVFSASTT